MLKNTEKYERKTAQGSTAITQAMNEIKNADEDVLIAKTKQVFSQVSPPNDNSQLNKYLSPPYTDRNKKDA
jgi:hypothetical protein